jgi:hypothetical protein
MDKVMLQMFAVLLSNPGTRALIHAWVDRVIDDFAAQLAKPVPAPVTKKTERTPKPSSRRSAPATTRSRRP